MCLEQISNPLTLDKYLSAKELYKAKKREIILTTTVLKVLEERAQDYNQIGVKLRKGECKILENKMNCIT